jgi:hypothetical protein
VSESLGIYARKSATASHPTAVVRASIADAARVGGTVIDSDEVGQAGEARRSVDSIIDVQDASPSTPFNVEA